jgi:hypothetical protein
VRNALAEVLQPKLDLDGATDTHKALLQLGLLRDGCLRIVTTNFDRIFEHVAQRDGLAYSAYAAPMLPIPKNSRWNGVAYLHGLLPIGADENLLNRLVVTSGDFGLAYLTERWAARFVGELFRNYTVCFVGYSINDPVLRYMMDALAADRMQGEFIPQAYALGDYFPGGEASKLIEWKAKGVTPILYEVSADTQDHVALHATLKVWAETYRDGVLGRERIVLEYALSRPSLSTKQDNFIGRMLWALEHHTGTPAKIFAEHNPVPDLEWLKVLTTDCYRYKDLARFGIAFNVKHDDEVRFSLASRPASFDMCARMGLLEGQVKGTRWDRVMNQLGRWLVRHLNDPELIFWIIDGGHGLHENLASLIDARLTHYIQLELAGKVDELKDIRANAPNAIPDAFTLKLWRLFMSGRIRSSVDRGGLHSWKGRLERYGISTSLRFELRQLLAPQIVLKKPFRLTTADGTLLVSESVEKNVDWELVLASDYVYDALVDWKEPVWRRALHHLFDDLQLLLKDALDVFSELDAADVRSDRSYWDLPSISQHWQNRRHHEWTSLIELVRDAWLAMLIAEPKRASGIALSWFGMSYPTFKRLALFAASQDDTISNDVWVNWLLAEDCWWMWAAETQREALRLIVLQGHRLNGSVQESLEAAILAGPPRVMFKADLEPERWAYIQDKSRWLHLAKLRQSGLVLGIPALEMLEKLEGEHRNWRLLPHERDEFSSWMSGTGDPDYQEDRKIDVAPRALDRLVKWLQKPADDRGTLHGDTWRESCELRMALAVRALTILGERGIWPVWRWRQALQAWSTEKLATESWERVPQLIMSMPPLLLEELAGSAAWWVETCAKNLDLNSAVFFELAGRLLDLPLDAATGIRENGKVSDEPVNTAINHPVGQVIQAVIAVWFNGNPNDNDGIPVQVSELLSRVCDLDVERFRHGRVVLAANMIAFFRVDSEWTKANLLPLLDWKTNAKEAYAAWDGFLWNPRLHFPLLIAFKPYFLDCARHYDQFRRHSRKYPKFLTYVALSGSDDYTLAEIKLAVDLLPQEGLNQVARALCEALEGAGDQREDYWSNRIQPFWQHVWPKSKEVGNEEIAASLARLAIAAGSKFPEVLSAMHPWLCPLSHPDYVLDRLIEADQIKRFPDSALQLIDAIVENKRWVPSNLGACLDELEVALSKPTLDPRFRRLKEYWRTRDM